MSLTPLRQPLVGRVRRFGQLIPRNVPQSAPAPSLQPIAAGWTGGGTPGVALDVSGGPAPVAASMTISGIVVDGTAIDDPGPISIAQGDDAQAVAIKVLAALNGLQDAGQGFTIYAARSGSTVNLAAAGGASNVFDADPAVAIS